MDRFENALNRTQDKKMTFLRRLELQEKFKKDSLAVTIDMRKERWRDVKDRQSVENEKVARRRFTVNTKSKKQNEQVKLAKDRSISQI